GHFTGSLPKYFHEMGVDTVIAGGAGGRAQEFFRQYNISLILGITGSIDDVIEKLKEGKLESKDSTCSPGAGKGYGIRKEDGHE
ncbi:MAG: NifB/NifX family molybdenum-iron cluster-binding protein, partial [archaeon]|nr:NifB/NifX family molybdenum-iron cluster-binding protein [archaeon]